MTLVTVCLGNYSRATACVKSLEMKKKKNECRISIPCPHLHALVSFDSRNRKLPPAIKN